MKKWVVSLNIIVCILLICGGCGTSSNDTGGNSAGEAEYSPSDGANNASELPSTYPADYGYNEKPPATSEQYEAVGTNPFVAVTHDPFSTFASDVDTASYDIFRRDIEDGRLPDPAAIRLEEFVNYFEYVYPAPLLEDEHPFLISLTAAPNLFDRKTTILRVGVQAEKQAISEKKPANIVFLVDVSGSMMPADKLGLVKHILTHALDVLDPTDMISIVTYASGINLCLEPTPVSDTETIAARINGLTAGGTTAGHDGISLAYEQAEAAFIENGINHVILCTDGDFNVGPSSDEALVELIEAKRESGITLTVLGFGYGNLNDSMMEKLSNAGNGTYAMISSETQASRYVEQRMLSNIIMVAKDMKIQVEFNPDYVGAYRLLGYENRNVADDDFRDDTVDAGEVGAGHQVTALYELVLVGDEIPLIEGAPELDDGDPIEGEREILPEEVVRVKVRYKNPDATEVDPAFETSLGLSPHDFFAYEVAFFGLESDFYYALAVAAFAEILKQSPFAYMDEYSFSTIKQIITAQDWLDQDRLEFKSLFETAESLINDSKENVSYCDDPAYLSEKPAEYGPGFIVYLIDGYDLASELNRFEKLYDIQSIDTWDNVNGLYADMSEETMELIRCEESVDSVHYNGAVYLQCDKAGLI